MAVTLLIPADMALLMVATAEKVPLQEVIEPVTPETVIVPGQTRREPVTLTSSDPAVSEAETDDSDGSAITEVHDAMFEAQPPVVMQDKLQEGVKVQVSLVQAVEYGSMVRLMAGVEHCEFDEAGRSCWYCTEVMVSRASGVWIRIEYPEPEPAGTVTTICESLIEMMEKLLPI